MAKENEIKPDMKVTFRGKEFTVAKLRAWNGQYGTPRIEFIAELHTVELPEVATVTVTECG